MSKMRERMAAVACIATNKKKLDDMGLPSEWCAGPSCRCWQSLALPTIDAILGTLPDHIVKMIDGLEPNDG